MIVSRKGEVIVLSSECHIFKSSGQTYKGIKKSNLYYSIHMIHIVTCYLKNLLDAILITVFIAVSNVKIMSTWSLQCNEGRYIINMQKLNSIISGKLYRRKED